MRHSYQILLLVKGVMRVRANHFAWRPLHLRNAPGL